MERSFIQLSDDVLISILEKFTLETGFVVPGQMYLVQEYKTVINYFSKRQTCWLLHQFIWLLNKKIWSECVICSPKHNSLTP